MSDADPLSFEFGQFYFVKNILRIGGSELVICISRYYVRLLCKVFYLIQFHEEDCCYSSFSEEADRKCIGSGFKRAKPGFQKVFK